ncbi:hypothetical protein IFM89_031981 [Coptis chinensis]|uniref:Uncharacterized protein n=1 Tax=Coptis chinensis TaxID=261450 RepID=A0A835HFL6_9MAGN|nr:hypothetical protein IFM89_031981 [Coptis chinensis]
MEYVSSKNPVKIPSSRKHPNNRTSDKLDNQNMDTETVHLKVNVFISCFFSFPVAVTCESVIAELCVLDLLGDDGPNENSEGSPVHESHVAFSVEGLGKMEMGTPVHSPRQPGRVFDGFLPPKPVRRYQSSKNLHYVNDFEFEVNAMIHDIDMPPCGNHLELPINLKGIKDHSSHSKHERLIEEECMPLDAHVCQVDNYFSAEANPYINDENERLWKAGYGFLDENFPYESTHDAAWKNQAYDMDSNYVYFSMDSTEDVSDFTFEDPYLTNKRDVAKGLGDFNILVSDSAFNFSLVKTDFPASYHKHQASQKEQNFININAKRNPAVNGSWDFNRPTWPSFAAEDAKDNTSLLRQVWIFFSYEAKLSIGVCPSKVILIHITCFFFQTFCSEESCSSSAVKGEKAIYSPRNSILGKGKGKYGSEFCRKNAKHNSEKDLYADRTVYKDGDKKHPGKDLKGSGKQTRVLNSSRRIIFNQSNSLPSFQKDHDSQHNWLPEEEFTSVDMDSRLNSFQRVSVESDVASVDYNYWSEDLFGVSPSSCLNTHSSCKNSKLDAPIKYAAPSRNSLFPEKSLSPQPFSPLHYYDSPTFLNIGANSNKPDITQASRMEAEPPNSDCATDSEENIKHPALSGQGDFYEDSEDESEVQPTGSGNSPKELEKEISVGNNDYSSENGKTEDAPGFKDNGKYIETEDGTSGHSDQPITGDSPKHVKETSSAKVEVPEELERCMDDKYPFDSVMHILSHGCIEGNVGKEDSRSEKINIKSDGHRRKDQSYEVTLESYVLLCVKKVLKEVSGEDTVRKV